MPDLILSPVKPCVKCGACERDKRGQCKACPRAATAAWRAANPDRVKAAASAWRAANPDRVKESNAAWRAANSERAKVTSAAWRSENPGRTLASHAAWREANPESIKTYRRNRRARKQAAGGKLSQGLAAKLFKLQKGKCACCKQPLGDDYHLDHVMPLALGGTNTDDNMQLLRATCNWQKSAKHPVDFMQSRGFLI